MQRQNTVPPKGPPPINSLITPSASPPVSRAFFPNPYHASGSAPPNKRPRLASTSSLSSVQDPSAFDLDDARRQSSLRVLNVWSQLAERYSRSIDEDDIVDLRTGDIVKDRGFLRSASQQFDIGFFADGDAAENESNGAQTEGEEDDVDELDAFAPGADISDELELEKERCSREVPPVRVLDPADAEDLREFMEAEQRRKEECGSDDDDEDDVVEFTRETEESSDEGWSDGVSGEVYTDVEELLNDVGDEVEDEGSIDAGENQESEDELAVWDTEEENTNYRVEHNKSDNEVIVIPSSSPSPPPPPRPRGRPRSRNSPKEQSSARPPSTSRSKSKSRSQTQSSAPPPDKPSTSSPSPPPVSRLLQLHTPPQSSSSVVDNTPDNFFDAPPPSSPSPQVKPRPRPRPCYKGTKDANPVVPTPSAVSSTSAPIPPSVPMIDLTETPTRTLQKKVPKPRLRPEVVITRRVSRGTISKSNAAPSVHVESSEDEMDHRIPSHEKGKGKAVEPMTTNLPVRERARDDVSASVPPSPESKGPPPVAKGRKRKRVVSSSSSEHKDEPPGAISVESEIDYKNDAVETTKRPVTAHHKSEVLRTSVTSDIYSADNKTHIHHEHSRQRALSHAPPDPNSYGYYPYPHHPQPYTPSHTRHAQPPYPPPPSTPHFPIQGAQAQFLIAQAMHHLSYLMTASGHADAGTQGGWPPQPPYGVNPSYTQPYTPMHHHHPHTSSSTYNTPTHPHPYPYSFTPSLSGGTLPPSSSPEPSSPIAENGSAKPRAPSLVRGRSKSRGRRVSFQLSDDQRDEIVVASSPTGRRDDHDHDAIDSNSGTSARRGRSRSLVPASSASKGTDKGKGKGKVRMQDLSDGEFEKLIPVPRFERGQTPAPPSNLPSSSPPSSPQPRRLRRAAR